MALGTSAAGVANAIVLPKLSISDKASIISRATATVGLDTGLSHIAAALDVPSITLYGETDPNMCGTIGKNQIQITSEFECVNCHETDCSFTMSAFKPAFVVVSTTKALDASSIAEKFARSIQEEPRVDVVEDLNEITTTYTAVGPQGERGLASYVLSARGYYAVLFWIPAPEPDPTAPTSPVAPATY